jgi:hypothetical protein
MQQAHMYAPDAFVIAAILECQQDQLKIRSILLFTLLPFLFGSDPGAGNPGEQSEENTAAYGKVQPPLSHSQAEPVSQDFKGHADKQCRSECPEPAIQGFRPENSAKMQNC